MSTPKDAQEEQHIADLSEQALEFGLITFGMGVASINPNIVVEPEVVQRLKARYRPGMGDYLIKHGVKFDDTLRKYLTKRGLQIGSKAARMADEFGKPTITGDLFDDAAVGVEAGIRKLAHKYEALYVKKLDIICPP